MLCTHVNPCRQRHKSRFAYRKHVKMAMTCAMSNLLLAAILACSVPFTISQCDTFIPDDEKRDCYPWPDANLGTCQARGCLWCENETPGIPWCFANDEVCASTIPESSRVDCHPEPGVSRQSCTERGCQYCPTQNTGIPWCFTDSALDPGGNRCPTTPEEDRVDCYPEGDVTMEKCIAKGCYYCPSANPGVPHCFTSPTMGYRVVGQTQTPKGFTVDLSRINTPSWFGEDMSDIRVDVEFQENERVRVKISDPNVARFEVPLNIPSPDVAASNPLYDVIITSEPVFSFQIVRISTGETLFDTSLGALLFADQYLQFAARLPTDKVYGFGETEHHTLRHDMNWRTWGMWTRDEPTSDGNIYGVHPYMVALDSLNNMFGMLILNSNAQEVVMTPAPGIVYRTIGGVLDLYFFLGPSPENVVQQYTLAVGRPEIPPYWMLGFHLSRYGYNTLENMSIAIDRLRQYDIPHDVQHGDIDYLERQKIFTYNTVAYAGMPEFVRELKRQGTRFITILDPFVDIEEPAGTYLPFERGQLADVWVKESDGVSNAESRCWPEGNVYYPDFSRQSTQDWWIQECQIFHETIEFDALWVDMNEPASFAEGSVNGCNNNKLTLPLFKPPSLYGPNLADKTLCSDFVSDFGNHFNTHNLYGWSSSPPSLAAARASTGTRSYVLTRSTFPGSGRYIGHWLGDNASLWDHLKYSVIGIVEFNFFGIPFIGADICGFFQDSNPSLCKRWMQLGAFYTFSRNHNGIGWADQDPGRWPDVAIVSRDTLRIRYTLLPYLYTLFYKSHVFGNSVLRPLFNEFVTDPVTHDIDEQFLWGEAFMISPVLYEGVTSVNAYFPDARWYSYYDGRLEPTRGAYTTLSAPDDFIPLHFRGGYVIPTQEYANSTMFSRSNPMGLIVTLDDSDSAAGSLYWDDEDAIDTYENGEYFLADYSVTSSVLSASVQSDGYVGMPPLVFNSIRVYGQGAPVTSVTVDGADWTDFTYDADAQVLDITALSVPVQSEFAVAWS